VLILITLARSNLFAQDKNLDQFNHNRNQINQYAMITRGSLVVGNMVVNGTMDRSGEKDWKYFYQMNIG